MLWKDVPEVCTVDRCVARGFGVVEVFAPRAVQLYGRRVGDVGLAHREEWLGFAHDAGAFSEVGFFELLELWASC